MIVISYNQGLLYHCDRVVLAYNIIQFIISWQLVRDSEKIKTSRDGKTGIMNTARHEDKSY